MFRISQLVFVFIFALSRVDGHTPQKLLITVYYESQCPDSKHYIVDQLLPTFNLLHKYLKLRLVPFGKARSINNGFGGFQCQHGPSECAGNLVQSCTLDLMQERNDVEKISYVACEMKTEAGTRGDMSCVRRAGVRVSAVSQCVNSDKGRKLQLADEYLTPQVSARFIPTTTINRVFDQQVQDSSLSDLTGTLCSRLTNVPQCAKHYNSMALRYILL